MRMITNTTNTHTHTVHEPSVPGNDQTTTEPKTNKSDYDEFDLANPRTQRQMDRMVKREDFLSAEEAAKAARRIASGVIDLESTESAPANAAVTGIEQPAEEAPASLPQTGGDALEGRNTQRPGQIPGGMRTVPEHVEQQTQSQQPGVAAVRAGTKVRNIIDMNDEVNLPIDKCDLLHSAITNFDFTVKQSHLSENEILGDRYIERAQHKPTSR